MFDTERVLQVAAAQLKDDPDGGAALCVIVDGEEVINAQWGLADAARGKPYDARSLQYPASMTKGVIAALLALLIDRGEIDPRQRIAHYWPEFAAPGKRDVTVEQLFSHQAGLTLLDEGYSVKALSDRQGFAARLAAQEPIWEPGTKVGYHCWTFANYADIIFEKATGKGVAAVLAELRPMLDVEIYFGLPREHWDRVVRLLPPSYYADAESARSLLTHFDPDSYLYKLIADFPDASFDFDGFYNGEAIRELPSAADNLFTSAQSLARLYAFLAAGGVWRGEWLCSAKTIAEVTRERSRGIDAGLGIEMAFGLGFQTPSEAYPFSSNPNAFGHAGAGGMIAFADPDARLAFAWMPTHWVDENPDLRWKRVADAVYEALNA
jgi:CubicO group peptidase (beta-lactamase class C family)